MAVRDSLERSIHYREGGYEGGLNLPVPLFLAGAALHEIGSQAARIVGLNSVSRELHGRSKELGEKAAYKKAYELFRQGSTYDKERMWSLFSELRGTYDAHLNPNEWEQMRTRFEMIWNEFEGTHYDELPQTEVAFTMHPRTTKKELKETDFSNPISASRTPQDAGALSPQIAKLLTNAPDSEILLTEIINECPPFMVATTSFVDVDGEEVTGGVYCFPINIDELVNAKKLDPEIYSRLLCRIFHGVEYAARRGVRYMGLGATLTKATRHGEAIKYFCNKEFGNPEQVQVTTGHASTVAAVIENMYAATAAYSLDVASSTLAIIGTGLIGSAVADAMYTNNGRPLPQKIICYDINPRNLEQFVAALRETPYGKNVEIEAIVGKNTNFQDDVQKIAQRSQIMIGATVTENKVQVGDVSNDGAIKRVVIDDSQPYAFEEEEADSDTVLIWPLLAAKGSDYKRNWIEVTESGIVITENTFHYGPKGLAYELDDNGDLILTLFSCEWEAMNLRRIKKFDEKSVTSRVTPELALDAQRTMHAGKTFAWIFPTAFQSHAKLLSRKKAA